MTEIDKNSLIKTISIEEEFAKNKELKQEDLNMLKDWVEKQPHLPKVSDLELIFFLHCSYYSIETAKTVLDTFYTIKTHCPDMFNYANIEETIAKHSPMVTFYNFATKSSTHVLYIHLNSSDISRFAFPSFLKIFAMFVELWLLQYGTAAHHVIILDLDNVTLSHLPKLALCLSEIKRMMMYLQEAIPFRLQNVHIINVVPFVDKILALVRPFMKKELYDSLVFHTEGLHTLYEYIPKEDLPKHLGGESPDMKQMHDKMVQLFHDTFDYFKAEMKYRVDESKRPGKAKDAGEIFGMEGSFKKLDID